MILIDWLMILIILILANFWLTLKLINPLSPRLAMIKMATLHTRDLDRRNRQDWPRLQQVVRVHIHLPP